MAIPFQEFRTQYPQGSLIADLISIYDNQFVVRASILVEGEPIASGLAMGQSVEAAEDVARDRALAVLGLSASSHDLGRLKPNTSEITQGKTPQREAARHDAAEESSVSTSAPITSAPISSNEQVGLDLDAEPTLTELEDLGPPIHEVVEEPLSAVSQDDASNQTVSAAAVALESFNTSALPVDLSDVIAQTDVELRRLGWTSTQGREYLEKTYGKRSRQQLTDDELMSFLLYLEEQ